MNNKTPANSTIVPILISVALVIAVMFMGYYFVIVAPKQKETEALLDLKRMETAQEAARKRVYEDCNGEAKEQAENLLESKIKIGALTDERYKKASEEGLYLKDDFDSYYDLCLKRHGIIE